MSAKRLAIFAVYLAVCVAPTQAAWPQEADPEEGDEAAVAPLEGDVLYLKSGIVMSGVQVLGSTPLEYEVEVVEGVEPLMIPRKQVNRVEYDDIDPRRDRRRMELLGDQAEVELASGELVSRELMEKLSAPATDQTVSYKDEDLISVLRQVLKKKQVKLRIHQSIRDMKPNQRKWTVDVSPETTVMAFLRENLTAQFKFAEVIFESDTVVIMTKKAAESLKNESAEQ